jgi:hypothetical protein
MNEWAKTVQMVYKKNKHRKGYKLKNAMMDAKKVYRKSGHHTKKAYRGGDSDISDDEVSGSPDINEMPEDEEPSEPSAPSMGGRRRRSRRHRTRKHRRSRRSRRH